MNTHPRARGHHKKGSILTRLAEKLIYSAEREAIPEESSLSSYYCDASIEPSVENTQAYIQAQSLYDEAIENYQEAIRYEPELDSFEYARAFRDRGYIYSRQGNDRQAVRDFEQAIYTNKKYAPAYFARGCVRAENGNYQDAIEDFTLAIRYGKGEDKKRLLAVSQDLERDFDKAESYFHRGKAYANLNQYQKAIQDYNKALKKYHLPQVRSAKYHYARANAFNALNKYKKAKEDYTQYLSYYADAPYHRQGRQIAQAYRKRADVRFELGEKQGAIEDYNYYAQVTGDTQTAEAYFARRRNLRNYQDK